MAPNDTMRTCQNAGSKKCVIHELTTISSGMYASGMKRSVGAT